MLDAARDMLLSKFFLQHGVVAQWDRRTASSTLDRAVTPIAQHDLLTSSYYMPVDLVWSCEVAEHITETKVDYYIKTLCNGKIIAMTHAFPNQVGHHHVNCQPSEYWIEKIATS